MADGEQLHHSMANGRGNALASLFQVDIETEYFRKDYIQNSMLMQKIAAQNT